MVNYAIRKGSNLRTTCWLLMKFALQKMGLRVFKTLVDFFSKGLDESYSLFYSIDIEKTQYIGNNRWIGPNVPVQWLPQSPNLTQPDFTLSGWVKAIV